VNGSGGLTNTGQIDIEGSATVQATLNVANAAAGFGTAGTETGNVYLQGDALLEFKSGEISTIDGGLQLNGANARIADQDAGGRLTTNYCVIWSGSGSTWIVACLDPTSIWTPPSGGWTTTLCDIEAIGKIPTSGSPGHAYV
jgi:hypothetical protein